MLHITFATFVSLLSGLVGHLIFYPLIEGWHSNRMRKLGRSGIGVLLNALPLLVWRRLLPRGDEEQQVLLYDLLAYCMSFLWNGAGVALGYVLTDLMDGEAHED